jgi:hypothetical protein
VDDVQVRGSLGGDINVEKRRCGKENPPKWIRSKMDNLNPDAAKRVKAQKKGGKLMERDDQRKVAVVVICIQPITAIPHLPTSTSAAHMHKTR